MEDYYDYIYTTNISLPAASRYNGTDLADVPLEERVFFISNVTMTSIAFAMDDIAPSFITSSNTSQLVQGLETKSFYKWRTPNPIGAHIYETTVNPWHESFDIASRMQDLANALTVTMRNMPSSDGSLDNIVGTAWAARFFVRIRWAWIILPMCLLIMTLGLLCATVVKSSNESSMVGIWKNSVIAILFNGLDENTQKSVSPNCRMGEARNKARELMVKLVPD
jgi:hypothetical protein